MTAKYEHYIARCRDGHPDDYHHLLQRYHPVLMAHLVGQLGNREQAEEVVQETFVRAYFALAKLQKRRSFFAWLMGICNRVVHEQQRRQRRERQVLQTRAQEAGPPSRTSHDFGLEHTIARLPDFYRELILLRYYGDRSCQEIADQLDMPLGTITKTLSRAYARLRELLEERPRVPDCEVSQ